MTKGSDKTRPDPSRDADAYALNRRTVAAILYAVDVDDREKLIELMEPLHPTDIADLLEQINSYDRSRLIRLYDKEFDGDILSELDESVREEVIGVLKPDVLAEAVRDWKATMLLTCWKIWKSRSRRLFWTRLKIPSGLRRNRRCPIRKTRRAALCSEKLSWHPSTGRWVRRSTSCAPKTTCPSNFITSFWLIPASSP